MVREADGTDQPVGDELGEGADRLLDRHVRIGVVELHDVDVVGAESSEAGLDIGPDGRR